MEPKLVSLKPQDVVVALRLAVDSRATYAELGANLSLSASTAHESVERLRLAGLLRPESLHPNRHGLLEFFEHGLRYVFPARPGSRTRGVPTAWSGPALSGAIVADDVVVWPSPHGPAYGQSIAPLLQRAAELPATAPTVYELLTLVDAIRIGRVRERTTAVKKLREKLGSAAPG